MMNFKLLASFLKFLDLDEKPKSKVEILTKQESKESIKESLLNDIYKLEAKDSIPLEKTITKTTTEQVGNEIITKEIIITETFNGDSIQTKTKTNTYTQTTFQRRI